MSTNRSRRIDRDTAERLLGGAVGGPSAGQDDSLTGPDGSAGQLARVLAAAAAPATADELSGEQAALTAFREARFAPDPVMTTPVRRRSMATAALARAFSTKAAAAVLGATALCGVAVAATGNLPPGLGGDSAEPERTLATVGGTSGTTGTTGTTPGHGTGNASASGSSTRPSGSGTTGAGSQALGPSGAPTPGTPSTDGRGSPSASPADVALCHVFTDRTGKGERPAKLVTEPQFGPLVGAAGGSDKVAGFCEGALGRASDDSHPGATSQPHDPGRNTGGPNPGASPSTGKGNTDGGKNGTGDPTSGGGDGTKNGKTGATVPSLPAVPTPPDVHPSKSDRPDTTPSAPR
ncbi:hypothetical protein [Kitasatospora sp. NPDC097643]|uniref:hypothetical protein n=1 Tax=Kitasatospora sp. NPDC097643 TaxID=3157230 RepID=UPI00331BE786